MLSAAVDKYVYHNQYGAGRDQAEAYLPHLLVDHRLIAAEEVSDKREDDDPYSRAERGVE